MSQHMMLVVDEQDQIIEKIPIVGGWQAARTLEKELKQKYQGRKVHIRDGYVGVDESLFESTKALLLKCQQEHPEMFEEVFDKDRPEFRHLGYKLKKLTKKQIKEIREKNKQ
jgi:hypothetical protein